MLLICHASKQDLLDNRNTYSLLKNDPTKTTECKLNKILLELKKSEKISESLYKRLHSSDGLPPRFYGLPKIHKPQIPLRPIVSFVDSPTYNLSSYLANILEPLVGNTNCHVKNSYEFASFIKDIKLTEDEELVSFDVVSPHRCIGRGARGDTGPPKFLRSGN